MYCPLHTRSCFSFLEGLPQPSELVKAALAQEMPALALTDHISMTGILSFYQECRQSGIQPVLGLEVDLTLPLQLSTNPTQETKGSLLLFARDFEGWKNLCKLSSAIHLKDGGIQSNSLDSLQSVSKGLVCLTGGMDGVLYRMIQTSQDTQDALNLISLLDDIFTDGLFIQIERTSPSPDVYNDQIIRIARQEHLPLVATNPIYYIHPSDAELQKIVSAIRTNTPLSRLPGSACSPPGAYFLSSQQMQARFDDLPDALEATNTVASMCNFTLPFGKPNFPKIPLPEGIRTIDLLRQKAESGAVRLYGKITPEIRNRLDTELSTIASSGYEPIFLIAEEMIAFAREKGIPSASRGSASSSLVAHCIGITTPDPLTLDLFFERFLNPARTTPPDIDTDFCSRRRDEVINHIFDLYGQDQVAMVGTINTYRPRSALGDVAKAYGLQPGEIRALTNRLHHRYHFSSPDPSEGEKKAENPYLEVIFEHKRNPKYQEVFRQALRIIGLPHHLSVHPGGIVIAPGPISEYVPVTRSGGKGVTITQFDLDDVERMGLVKLDLLGIRGLTVLGDLADNLYSWRRMEFNAPLEVLEKVPLADEETSRLVSSGRTIGCFQIESPGMRATLKDIQAKTPEDIMAALALYRPGPLKGGLRDAFIRRYKHQEEVTHIHPSLSSLLHETYGVILYQEQVLRIAHDLAGFSLAEADLLRRAMSHFDPGKQMTLLQEKFVSSARSQNGIPEDTALRIWEMMAAFAGYGFPKAHAASYAQVAWRSAWCKAHYPAEFLAAVLANWGGYYPQSIYLSEARRLKLKVHPPHVNHSQFQFSVVYPQGEPVLYMGLDQLRDLTRKTQEKILRYRPFHTLAEFLYRVNPRKQEVDNLIRVGALEKLGTIPALLNELETGFASRGQLSLFPSMNEDIDDWSIEQKMAAQQSLLGASLEAHPLELVWDKITSSGVITTMEAATRIDEMVRVAGIRQTLVHSRTGQKELSGFLTLEDLEGTLEIILPRNIFQRYRDVLSTKSLPIIVEGVMERDESSGEPILHAQKIWRIGG